LSLLLGDRKLIAVKRDFHERQVAMDLSVVPKEETRTRRFGSFSLDSQDYRTRIMEIGARQVKVLRVQSQGTAAIDTIIPNDLAAGFPYRGFNAFGIERRSRLKSRDFGNSKARGNSNEDATFSRTTGLR
jgi:hypothetical protein